MSIKTKVAKTPGGKKMLAGANTRLKTPLGPVRGLIDTSRGLPEVEERHDSDGQEGYHSSLDEGPHGCCN